MFVDQVEHDSLVSLDALEVMSECDMPIAFTRGSRSRASLPVVRSTNQTKDRSLGIYTDTQILNYIQKHLILNIAMRVIKNTSTSRY